MKLHTVCEITQCAQNYIYSIGKNSSQLKKFTLTPWAAWATNISCGGERTRVVGLPFRKSDKSKYFLRHPVRSAKKMLQGLPSGSEWCKQMSHWHWPCLFDLLNRYAWPDYRKVEYFLPFEKTFLYFMPLIAPKYSLTWLATGSHEMDQFHILNVRNEIHFWIEDIHSR